MNHCDIRVSNFFYTSFESLVKTPYSSKGNDAEECQNYIKVLQQYENDPDRYLICGTNAYKPSCRTYVDERGSYVMRDSKSGLGLAPFR